MLKKKLIKIHWFISSQLGIDFRKFFQSLRGFGSFLVDWWNFRRVYNGEITIMPCLHDRYDNSGIANGEYFWQDLVVARWIAKSQPARHVDVGSRIDGFVAHVASFREIEVFDIRTISNQIPGVTFKQADFMRASTIEDYIISGGYCDSLSCLHALEHFGLGRYGDRVDPDGYKKGIENLSRLIMPLGKLYLSTPIGREKVEFNSNWVFNPRKIIEIAQINDLQLFELYTLNNKGTGIVKIDISESKLNALSDNSYNLGIFIFIKLDKNISK
jgi:hypothetical protein